MMLSKPPKGSQLDFSHRLNKGLVGFWLFNEGHGNKAYDLSRNKNTGTLTNMELPATAVSGWNPGRKGIGLNFDGVDDYATLGSNTFTLTDFSISAWINMSKAPNGYGTIVGSQVGGNYELDVITDRRLLAYSQGGLFSSDYLNLNQWYHIVLAKNSNGSYLYINGILDASNANTTTINTKLQLGRWNTSQYFPGSIDDVRIYKRALTAQEVLQLYKESYCMFKENKFFTYFAPPAPSDLIVADITSSPTVEGIALTQAGGDFALANLAATPTIENITIVFNGGTFTIADLASSPTIENIGLIGNFKIDDLASNPTIENIELVYGGGIFQIADLSSTPTIENISLLGNFIIADLSSTPTVEEIVLTQNSGLFIIADLASVSTIEEITIAEIGDFIIADLIPQSVIDNIALVQASGLFSISDLLSQSTIENITLIVASGSLFAADIASQPTIQNITLEQGYIDPADNMKTIILADSGEIAIWIEKNVYIHAPPH